MRTHNVRFILSLLMVLSGMTSAQPQGPPRSTVPLQFAFLSARSLPGTDSLTSRVDVLYTIERDFFVPLRTSDNAATSPFVRNGEMLIELFDSAGVSVTREFTKVSIPDFRSEPVPGERFWYEGITTFTVPAGKYKVFFEATDRQSQRRYVHPPLSVQAVSGGGHPFTPYGLSFVSRRADDRIVLDTFGNDMLFSAQRDLLVACVLPHDTTTGVVVKYWITLEEKEGQTGPIVVADTVGFVPLLKGKNLVPEKTGGPPAYLVADSPGNRVAYLTVPLRTETLPLRSYLLTVHFQAGADTASLTRSFRNIWPTMPLSLKDLDRAFESLRFVTTENQLDSLKRGSFEKRRENLERFWSTRDATPGTAMNEVMAEYYRRVDHAQREFVTLREQDGTKTDRGRIFILYGPPTLTERSLQPSGGHTETWIYERSRLRFTFVDEKRNGTYSLLPSAP